MAASRTLTFHGGAGTVTGSKYLVTNGSARVLLDCGLFQGQKELRVLNWEMPPVSPRSLDAIIVSHGHLDHTGALPLFVKHGYSGPIYCTRSTVDLLRIVLIDAAHLMEEDAARANRYGYSKHKPALPLYSKEDVERTMRQVVPQDWHTPFEAAVDVTVQYHSAGHILGSAIVDLRLGGHHPLQLVFSGDLGRWDRPIIPDPELVRRADVLLVESTYGDREHGTDSEERLVRTVRDTAARGGAVIVPAFAIGRTQELLWTLSKLKHQGRIPAIPVYLDSPMAIAVTDVYGDQSADRHHEPMAIEGADFTPLATPDESKRLNTHDGPFIVIAGSGMATGGRVLHHLKERLPSPKNTVLLPGYQAEGTRGRALQDGVGSLRMFGEEVEVRAEVVTLDGFSAHADKNELMRWLRGFEAPPRHTWVVHGEPPAAAALAEAVRTSLGWQVEVARRGETVALG